MEKLNPEPRHFFVLPASDKNDVAAQKYKLQDTFTTVSSSFYKK
jgi:hypothetical protein